MNYVMRVIKSSETKELKKVFAKTLSEFPEYSKNTLNFFSSNPYKNRMISLPIRIGAFVDNKLVAYIVAPEYEGGIRGFFGLLF